MTDNPRRLTSPPIGGELRQKPWAAIGISRATWYRLGKPTTKPVRRTQAQAAALMNVGVRSIQRARRIQRLAPELEPPIMAGKLKLGTAEDLAKDPPRKAWFIEILLAAAREPVNDRGEP